MGRQRYRLAAPSSESVKVELVHLIGKFPADYRGPIGAVRVHNDQLITPACHRLEASPHIGLVIVGDDVDRELSRMLKKSASLSCSFGLFGLSGLFG